MLGLTTPAERRIRGDIIKLHKFKKGFNKINWYHPIISAPALGQAGPVNAIRRPKHNLYRQFVRNCAARSNLFLNRTVHSGMICQKK